MPVFVREHLRSLVGSTVLHVLLLGAVALTALRWASAPPTPPPAIEGEIVQFKDLPPALRAGRSAAPPAPAPTPTPTPVPKETPPPKPEPDSQALARAQAQQAAKADAAAKAAQAAKAEKAEQAAQAAADQARAREAKRKAEEAEARRQAALDAKAQQEAKQKAAQEAQQKAAREAELKRALASEEEGAAVARSGVTDEYRALLVQTIERNWIRPPSARPGLECTLNVTQATGGTVTDVQVGACNGDQAVRESITNAVYRSSPLPAPRDPRVFARRLVIVFKPTE